MGLNYILHLLACRVHQVQQLSSSNMILLNGKEKPLGGFKQRTSFVHKNTLVVNKEI